MDELISIIVPVYNAEKYLPACVESLLGQTYGVLEVILVNDGSKDSSAALCDAYAARDSRVRVIHQENQGVSAARNAGISAACGEYILFLDGDDDWNPKLLNTLDQFLSQQPDMIEFGYTYIDSKGEQPPELPAVEASGVTGMEFFAAHERKNRLPIASSCTAAFRRSFLEAHEFRFPMGLNYGEDLTFHMHCLKAAGSVFSIRQSLYRYRMNESGATYNLTVKKMGDILRSCVNMYRLFPSALCANYYCMKILNLERLSRRDAMQLYDLLRENRDILNAVSGRKMHMFRALYHTLGWYPASKVIRFLIDAKYRKKG